MKGREERMAYVNGQFYPESEAKISILDHLVIWGDGVYEVCCAWGGELFRVKEHIQRLWDSAKCVRLEPPVTREELEELLHQVVQMNHLQDAYVKVIFSRGVGDDVMMDPSTCKAGIIIFARPYINIAGGGTSLKAKISSIRRIPDECLNAKVKSCNYMNHVMVTIEARECGCDVGIELRTDGYVAEGPGYNVFMVKSGVLLTPGENILEGITRKTIMELAKKEGITVNQQAQISSYDLYTADEVFFTSTAGGVLSISEIDGQVIGDGCMGPMTKKLYSLYMQQLQTKEE